MNEFITFGKYKGQPIEVLASDPKYCEWLSCQDWFRSRYSSIYNVIINNFVQTEDTPEHNRMQALFLDNSFCKAAVELYSLRNLDVVDCIYSTRFEEDGFDVFIVYYVLSEDCKFKHKEELYVELKPSIGDDYPSVLRQIKSSRMINYRDGFKRELPCCLIYDAFSADGVSEATMRSMFKSSNIPAFSISDINNYRRRLNA